VPARLDEDALLPAALVREAIDAGWPRSMMTLAVAGWFRYLEGEDYVGAHIEIEGSRGDELTPLARQDGADPRPLLDVREVFDSLADIPSFVRDLHVASEALGAGPRETIETSLAIRGPR
jgi:mannitol 2-dehydrogenase